MAPLPRDAEPASRCLRGELGDGRQRQSPLMMARFQQHGQPGLHAGDAAPHAKEIGVAFQIGRARRMVGGDDIDAAIHHVLPQRAGLGGGAQRRRALGGRAEPDHIFFGKEQVVRASLDGEIGAAGARFQGGRNSASGADMDDVQPGARFPRQQGGALDGLHLGEHRARSQKGANVAAAGLAYAPREAAGDLLAFGVHRDGQIGARRQRACLRRASGRPRAGTRGAPSCTGKL